MATSSASLVVKISADITDFTKQLNTATRVVDQASTNQIANSRQGAHDRHHRFPCSPLRRHSRRWQPRTKTRPARLERVFGCGVDVRERVDSER
jgi:hypothetical protein